jgi:hypothetical protein
MPAQPAFYHQGDNMKIRLISLFLLLGLVFGVPLRASAASDYSFSLDKEVVQVYWNLDGTESFDYVMAFSNDPGAHTIDYVDMGMPNSHFDMGNVKAFVTADRMTEFKVPVSKSDYEGSGSGFAVQMSLPIYAGESGSIHVTVGQIAKVLYKDDTDPSKYASAVFSPTWFSPKYVHGTTDLTVIFHLPPGVQPDEARYHPAGSNWPGDPAPAIGSDSSGNITYTWHSPSASGGAQYLFGASFPQKYVLAGTVATKPLVDLSFIGAWFSDFGKWLSNNGGLACNCTVWGVIGLAFVIAAINGNRRKLEYLPPKISIEGHGIKRGLTAVEAGILMQEPLDKVLTMILFGVIKKNAATVTSKDPLKLDIASPQPADLNDYEKAFLSAFAQDHLPDRRKSLQEMTISLVKSVSEKMKGFSRKETVAYYKDIMERAWKQIEDAGTPELKSQAYDQSLEWTMLDKNYEQHTHTVFHGPFIVPVWWGRYDPGFHSSAASTGSNVSLPTGRGTLPGSALAASVVTGVQGFSSKVLGDVKTFTSGVSAKTNPVPVSSGSSGHSSGGGSHCACACACAGCACACAGGGR